MSLVPGRELAIFGPPAGQCARRQRLDRHRVGAVGVGVLKHLEQDTAAVDEAYNVAMGKAAPLPLKGVVVDGGAIHDVDLMGCETLVELDSAFRDRGIRLVYGNLRDRVKRDIERGLQLGPNDGDDVTFPSVAAAAEAVRAS